MMNEEMKVELGIRDKQDAEKHVKKCGSKRSKQLKSEEEKEQHQQPERKKKRKKHSKPSGRKKMSITTEQLRSQASDPFQSNYVKRPRGRPRIHPKKERMCFTMDDLRMKASDPFLKNLNGGGGGKPRGQ